MSSNETCGKRKGSDNDIGKSKVRRTCTYNKHWEKDFPILPAENNPRAFYCIPCKKVIQCGHQGKGDVERHCDPTRVESTHNKNLKSISMSAKLPFTSANAPSSPVEIAATKAEILHTNMIVHHNLPFALSDHLSKLYPIMFPDSKIAKKFSCARTKTTQILNRGMMPVIKSYVVDQMKSEPFSLVNDGTSDTGLKKMNAACVLIFDVKRSNKVEFKFFDMCTTTGEHASKAATLFDSINAALEKSSILWDNCVSFGVDNCNTNIGSKNSLKTRIIEKCNHCFLAGCSCHLSHLAAEKGGNAYAHTSGFNMEDHQIDLYYYFKGSTRRKGILAEFVDFIGLEWENMPRFVKTRWLCLEKCLNKEQKQYAALESMFNSRTQESSKEDKGKDDESGVTISSRYKRLKKSFSDPLTEVHVAFFISALPVFTNYNLFLQRSDPLAHKVYPMTQDLARKIGSRFLQSEALENVSLETLEDERNFLPISEIHIGYSTTVKLVDLYEEGVISESQKLQVFEAAQMFYKSSLKYVLKKICTDNFWCHAQWIDFEKRKAAKWDDVLFFARRYSTLLKMNESKYDYLFDQFQDYRTLHDSEIDLTEALISTNNDGGKYRMDTIWYLLQKLKSPAGNNFRFHTLFEVARLVLITPHSNAGIERVYSLVNKNKPEGSERNRLDIDGSLSSIIAVKLDRPESSNTCCYTLTPSSEMLEKAKKATKDYNQAHSSANN